MPSLHIIDNRNEKRVLINCLSLPIAIWRTKAGSAEVVYSAFPCGFSLRVAGTRLALPV